MLAETFLRMATVDMTPPDDLPLGGYTERGAKLGHGGPGRLFARVLLFSHGDRQVAVVSFETLTIPESLVRETRQRLPGVELMLVATHTHSAPDSQMLNDRMTLGIPGIANYRQKWLRWTADKLASAVILAQKSPPETVTTVETGSRVVENANRNRRGGTPPDPHVRSLWVNGRLRAYSFAAHATLLGPNNLEYSGDWPGAVSEKLMAGFLPAAIGDASHVSPGIEKVAEPPVWRGVASDDFWFGREPIKLSKPVPHPRFAADYKVNDMLAKLMVDRFAPTTAELTILTLGRLAIVGVPGEPTGDVGRRIEAEGERQGFWQTWVVSHCNGWIGYILEPSDYDKGGYEADLALHGRETADRVVEAARSALARASAQRRPH